MDLAKSGEMENSMESSSVRQILLSAQVEDAIPGQIEPINEPALGMTHLRHRVESEVTVGVGETRDSSVHSGPLIVTSCLGGVLKGILG